MNIAVSAALIVVLVGSVYSGSLQRHKRWSVYGTISEPAPSLTGMDLVSVLSSAPDIRYSDWAKKLTALKSSKYKSCFIVDLDPNFWLQEQDMDKTTTENVPEVIDSPPAYYAFREKAGHFIGPMCQQMDIYWLNQAAPPVPVGNNPSATLPQPIGVRINDTPLPVPDIKAPPPVGVYRQQHPGPATPPPISLYLEQQANQNVQQTEHVPATPPPVALYRQQHGN